MGNRKINRSVLSALLLAFIFCNTIIPIDSRDFKTTNDNFPNTSYDFSEEWYQYFGGSSESDYSYAVWSNSSEIYTAGYTFSLGEGYSDVYLQKWDVNGSLIWSEVWGGYQVDQAFDVVVEGQYVYVCGYSRSYSLHGLNDILVMKWDTDGNLIWFRIWGEIYDDAAYGIDVTDSNIYVTGFTGGYELILLKYDLDGNLIWDREFAGSNTDYGYGVIVEGDYIYTTGKTTSYGAGSLDILLIKWNFSGDIIWFRTWGGSSTEEIRDSAWTDGTYIYTGGWTISFGNGQEAALVKWDMDGNQIWNATFGGPGNQNQGSISGDPTGIYIGGSIDSYFSESKDIFIAKYYFDGSLIKNTTWGSLNHEYGYDISVSDSCIYTVGRGYHTTNFSTDALLLKLNYFLGPEIFMESPARVCYQGGSQIDFNIIDIDLDSVIYNWDGGTNQTWESPYTTLVPMSEGSHTLYIYANNTCGNATEKFYDFDVDNTPPTIVLDTSNYVLNNSYQEGGKDMHFIISDDYYNMTQYCWDEETVFENTSSDIYFRIPYGEGIHSLWIESFDSAGNSRRLYYTIYTKASYLETLPNRDLYAISMGVSYYAGYTDGYYADDDSYDLQTWLRTQQEIPSNQIDMYTNSAATSQNLNTSIQDFSEQMDEDDYLFLHFSGAATSSLTVQEFDWHVESPHNYPNNYDNTWTFDYLGADMMRVHFTKIELYSSLDDIYIGDSADGGYGDQHIQYDYPTGCWSDWITIDGVGLFIRLITSSSGTDWGFEIDKVQVGHKTQDKGICTYDRLYNGINSSELNSLLSSVPGKLIIMLDCDYSGEIGAALSGPNRYIITSGTGSELTWEDSAYDNRIFTYHFVSSWYNADDLNGDGIRSFEEMFSYAFTSTVARSSFIGTPQHPQQFNGLGEDIILLTRQQIFNLSYGGESDINITFTQSGLGYSKFELICYDLSNQEYIIHHSHAPVMTVPDIQDFQFSGPPGFHADIYLINLDTSNENTYYGARHYSYSQIVNFTSYYFSSSVDTDGDTYDDYSEFHSGMNPWSNDSDNDGMTDQWELLNGMDPKNSLDKFYDEDYDGLQNYYELTNGTNPQLPDTDGDMMFDGWEVQYSFDPLSISDTTGDFDADGVNNFCEFGNNTNPWSSDTDYDQMPDFYEILNNLNPISGLDNLTDSDMDGLLNYYEMTNGTNPSNPDTDSDLMEDGWEVQYSFDPLNATDALDDFDLDGLINVYEAGNNTNPWNSDTDSDQMLDLWEVTYGLNATDASNKFTDPDLDSLPNYYEMTNGTNPINPDTDSDLMWDGWELQYLLDPLNVTDGSEDLDLDGLINVFEFGNNTDPTNPDTDFDQMSDFWETLYGLNATDASNKFTDPDLDGIPNYYEMTNGTNPINPDTDSDLMWDEWELHYLFDPLNASDGSEDFDLDGLINVFEFGNNTDPTNPDTDFDQMSDFWETLFGLNATDASNKFTDIDLDGIPNYYEMTNGTNPINPDTDYDLMWDGWEVQYTLDPLNSSDSTGDLDLDGLNNRIEQYYNTSPLLGDTDADGMSDYFEVVNFLDPLVNDGLLDYDGDGLSNFLEFSLGSLPNEIDTDMDGLTDYEEHMTYNTSLILRDTDGDGLVDGDEVRLFLCNPTMNDTDSDTLNDYEEVMIYHTNPSDADSDNDGINDALEVRLHTDPLSAASSPWIFVASAGIIGLGIITRAIVTIQVKNTSKKKKRITNLGPRPQPSEISRDEIISFQFEEPNYRVQNEVKFSPIVDNKSTQPPNYKEINTPGAQKLLSGECPICMSKIDKYTMRCTGCMTDFSGFYHNYLRKN